MRQRVLMEKVNLEECSMGTIKIYINPNLLLFSFVVKKNVFSSQKSHVNKVNLHVRMSLLVMDTLS